MGNKNGKWGRALNSELFSGTFLNFCKSGENAAGTAALPGSPGVSPALYAVGMAEFPGKRHFDSLPFL
jgi:hypothetical protein